MKSLIITIVILFSISLFSQTLSEAVESGDIEKVISAWKDAEEIDNDVGYRALGLVLSGRRLEDVDAMIDSIIDDGNLMNHMFTQAFHDKNWLLMYSLCLNSWFPSWGDVFDLIRDLAQEDGIHSRRHRIDAVRRLMEALADAAEDSELTNNWLIVATEQKDHIVLSSLLEAGANDIASALEVAVKQNDAVSVNLLVGGTSLPLGDAFLQAVENGNLELAVLLDPKQVESTYVKAGFKFLLENGGDAALNFYCSYAARYHTRAFLAYAPQVLEHFLQAGKTEYAEQLKSKNGVQKAFELYQKRKLANKENIEPNSPKAQRGTKRSRDEGSKSARPAKKSRSEAVPPPLAQKKS